jgi:hypothetical protein
MIILLKIISSFLIVISLFNLQIVISKIDKIENYLLITLIANCVMSIVSLVIVTEL